jgi:hypothetical protein
MIATPPDSHSDLPIFSATNFEHPMVDTSPSPSPSPLPPPNFGILNLVPNSITTPPEFTEPATLEAMRNLQIHPRDLVPQDPPPIDDLVLRLHLAIEFERRRYETISKIIAERNRVLKQIPALPAREKKPTKIKKRNFGGLRSHRRVSEMIKQNAQMRLAKAKDDESAFERRRQQLRQAKEAELQRQERNYLRLQEKKQKEFEERRKWLRENVYKGLNQGKRNQLLERFAVKPAVIVPDFAKPAMKKSRRRLRELPVIGVRRTKIPCLKRFGD